ncbi:MAG: hypothetical protein JXX28_01540 [Deltaproteobacteria bacterium]|nr:hypothetical protein [Deltaproteobacteria bacterium]
MRQPLVLIGVGPAGTALAEEILDTARVRPSGELVGLCLLEAGELGGPRLRRSLRATLDALLEAGRIYQQGAQAQLDLAILADLAEGTGPQVSEAVAVVTQLLADTYGVLFPASVPAAERSAWLTVYLAAPPLIAGPQGEDAIARLRALEEQAATAPHPALSRVWVLPRQTTAGQLSDRAVRSSLRLMVQGLFLSGVRREPDLHALIRHRPDGRLISTASVGAAELPVARVRRYARWRAAWEGLSTLVEQAEQNSRDEARRLGYRSQLDLPGLLGALTEGRAAADLRKHAVELTGLTASSQGALRVGLLAADGEVRAAYPLLFRSLHREQAAGAEPSEALLHRLDEAESDTLSTLSRRLQALLASEISPDSALQVLPDLEAALQEGQRWLAERLAPASTEALWGRQEGEEDLALTALEAALVHRPRLTQLVPVGATLGLVWGTVTGMALHAYAAAPAAAAPAFSTGAAPAPTDTALWGGIAAGALLTLAWVGGGLWAGRARLLRLLHRRQQELEELRQGAGAGLPARRATDNIALRHARAGQALSLQLQGALDRLTALRAALRQARGRAAEHLERLQISLGPSQRMDDLSGLLGEDTPLHRALLPPERLAERIAATRTTPDKALWAQRLLQATWPSGGLATDLPLLDEAPLARECDRGFEGLAAARLLQGPEVQEEVARRVEAFLQGAEGALAFGVRPRDEHGDLLGVAGQDAPLLIAPIDLRVTVDQVLPEGSRRVAWGTANSPWIIALRTWDGLDAGAIGRGVRG